MEYETQCNMDRDVSCGDLIVRRGSTAYIKGVCGFNREVREGNIYKEGINKVLAYWKRLCRVVSPFGWKPNGLGTFDNRTMTLGLGNLRSKQLDEIGVIGYEERKLVQIRAIGRTAERLVWAAEWGVTDDIVLSTKGKDVLEIAKEILKTLESFESIYHNVYGDYFSGKWTKDKLEALVAMGNKIGDANFLRLSKALLDKINLSMK